MTGQELIQSIIDLQKQYPEHLKDLYIEGDQQYVNKYMIGFNKSSQLDIYNIGDVVKTGVMIDIKEYYDYNSRIIIYLQEKDSNADISKIFFTNIINNIPNQNNSFPIDFINTFILN